MTATNGVELLLLDMNVAFYIDRNKHAAYMLFCKHGQHRLSGRRTTHVMVPCLYPAGITGVHIQIHIHIFENEGVHIYENNIIFVLLRCSCF